MPFAQYNRKSRYNKTEAEEPYSLDTPRRQIDNATLRINDAGFQPKDTRNWFEKATNLPENQNMFLDTLELLNRPTQGVMNALHKRGTSTKPLEAFKRGFSGEDRTSGADVAEKWGVENKVGKFLLGTGLEIALDPLNIVPVGAVAKGASAVRKGVSKGFNAAENAIPAVRTAKEVAEPIVKGVKEGFGKVFVPKYGWERTLTGEADDTLKKSFDNTNKNIRVMSEKSMGNIADVAKKTGLDAGEDVGRIMEKDLLRPNRQGIGELDKEISDMESYINGKSVAAKQAQKEGNIFSYIKSRGGIKPSPSITGEYLSSVPKALKNKNGMAIDELADELGMDSRRLLDELNKPKSRAFDINNDPEVQAIRGTIKELKIERDNILKKPEYAPKQEVALKNPDLEPQTTEAARSLLKSNDVIRQYALDNGIDIKEMEGYMAHILSAEERKLRKTSKAIPIDRGNFGAGQPNKKILNSRTLEGSAEEINEQVGRKLFEPNAYFATAIGQKRLIEYANSVKFRREVLSNPNFAKPFTKGELIPEGAEVIDTNNYKFIKDEVLDDLGMADEIGGQYIVTKGAKEALDRYKKLTTDEGVNTFLKAFDATQSAWKRAALFSIPYHLRNDVGAKFNNWVAGMDVLDLAKYSAKADSEVFNAIAKNNPSPLYQEYVEQGLGSTNLSKVEFRPFGEPEEALKKTVELRSKTGLEAVKHRANPLNWFETSREFGEFVDQTNRFALYKWAREAKKLSPEEATEMVNRVQFDYTNLTTMEKEGFTRAFPFYRWMRNNIPYQLTQFAHDPLKYSRINKIRVNSQEAVGIDEENVPEWMKESFAIAVQGDGSGSGKFLSMSLPLGDLLKVSNPMQTVVDAASPLIKTPTELTLNRNFFYDKPIEKFEGQEKQFQIPGTDVEFGIPSKTAYALEQATGQIGRGFSQYFQKPQDTDQDTKFRTPSMGISSVIKDFDAKKAEYFETLQKLQQLQDQLDYIEQQTGQRPRTVREIR